MKLKTTTTTSFTYDHHSYHHQSTIHSTPHTTIAINRIRVVIFVVDITFLVLVIVIVVIAIVVIVVVAIRNWLPWHRRGIPLRPRSTPGKTEKVRGRMIEAFYFLPLTINSTLMKKY